MLEINERTTCRVVVSFFDESGDPTTPVTVAYRVDCYTSGTAILGWTAVLDVGTTVEIQITAAQNAIQTSTNAQETKVVTVRADSGLDSEANAEYRYVVNNLTYVT